MTLRLEQSAFAKDIVTFLMWAHSHGYEVTFGEALRTPEQQQVYVQTGRSQTMKSLHLKKLAFDLHFFKDGKYLTKHADIKALGDFWESLGTKNTWGGNWKSFKDLPHFQRSE